MTTTPHPWHRAALSVAERRDLNKLEQQLIEHYQGTIPAGRIIRMVHGTARLLRSNGVTDQALREQVEAACRTALNADLQHTPNVADAIAADPGARI